MNRVVITGYGVASPIGNDPATFLKNLKIGKNGIGPITKFDANDTGITLAGEIKDFPYDKYFVKKDLKRMDMFSLYGVHAALEALEMSQLDTNEIDKDRFGVIVGSGIGGLETLQNQVIRMHDKGPQRVAPLFVPISIINMAAGNIALRVDAQGVCTSIVTACATANNSIGEAFRNIKHGYSDIILAGGSEASITEIGISGFSALTALSKSTDPNRGSIPFDKERNGFVMGEGSGILVLESLDHALARDANILGEIVGYGATCDAYHMTAPLPDGSGAAKAMRLAIEEAGIEPDEIGYINAHGTATVANDLAESKAILSLFGEEKGREIPVSSTKSMTGHLLGGAGGIEGIATLNALQEQFIPPTINIDHIDEEITINVITNQSKDHTFNYALSNSLGFGGHNAVICLKRWED
ncbi:3-oxoacyl-(acyl-carrier-protein) synthase 2 [Melissococcus plutonius]|uniref:beta-ketoacyl-ACP synthase II n=1 Tax=Melissococcus plutonius TaxID=33970 RepID=UPI00065E5522|nr:beta-ketoacyl-ACP synthase II [Melissococcus plutonius]KMT24715.1 3-oxoacyl-(acyl-carrier-protein) synthase 2 [Melissococcus plutonius]KMT29375.1 3-oxoacyl-(acyl-carrier-protein) synthase 2 [Melissococcus plutonius]KMT36259.1 3-oxoacyl-(acyl-carrier-protein) synthase 2 [Melissococcus plutonius]KMT36722.1 3-oxoacyl-(acyl-carrier-protein) synthase 2 [Melissococcus plutonius]KMT39292.1 3-oxoacyl-(acyl-carrier-protein) synthase 2 [Melissococcus plutonius]